MLINPYDVFVVKGNGTYLWIGDGDSMTSLWTLVESCKPQPEDKFMIYDRTTGNITEIEAGHFRASVVAQRN